MSLTYRNTGYGPMVSDGLERLGKLDGCLPVNLLDFFYQSYLRDGPMSVLIEAKGALKNGLHNNIDECIGENKKKVFILIPGFGATTELMYKLKDGLQEQGYSYYGINYRVTPFTIKKQTNNILKAVFQIINNNPEKDIITLGYSYGGFIAENIALKKDLKCITISSGDKTENIPLPVLLKYLGIDRKTPTSKKTKQNKKTVRFGEEFSFSAPYSSLDDYKIFPGQKSHFPLHRQNNIDLILKETKII